MIIYDSTESKFDHNGNGFLSDAISAFVTEERNGIYELEIKYPIGGKNFNRIENRAIITAKPAANRTPQPFRVYRITKPLNGIVTVHAAHISYDLSGIVAEPFKAGSAIEAMSKLQTQTFPQNPFTMWTNKSVTAEMNNESPFSVRALLGGMRGSILDTYGGEFEFDNMQVKLYDHRGQDNGVSIRYGKNLTDLVQEENCSKVRTGVYPYWKDPNTKEIVSLPEKVVNAPGTYDFVNILPLDFTNKFEEKPSVAELKSAAESYAKSNKIGVPKVSLKVSFVNLENSEEYKGISLLERVNLCDTVNVSFPKLGVNATAKCVKTVFNVLLNRMERVELGESRTNIADTIVSQSQDIKDVGENIASGSYIQGAVDTAMATILGANGGAVRMLDENKDGMPDTLYIADNPDPEKAVKVWRFNYEGWAASKSGYNGPFSMAATLNEGFYADFITTGELNAGLIKAGVIQDKAGNVSMNLDAGTMDIKNGSINLGNGNFSVNDKGYLKTISGQVGNFTVTPYYLENNLLFLAGNVIELKNSGTKFGSIIPALGTKNIIYFSIEDNVSEVRFSGKNGGFFYDNTTDTFKFNSNIDMQYNRIINARK